MLDSVNAVEPVWYQLPPGSSENVAAYIDGLFGDEIRGWAIDRNQPDRILRVAVRINGMFAGVVATCLYRPDLAGLFHSEGNHGFAFRVPEPFFSYSQWQVEALLEDGRFLSPRPVRIANPGEQCGPRRPIRSPCLLYLHIPKTAGTTLRGVLNGLTQRARHLILYPNAPGFRGEYLLCLSESQLANLEVVYGHFGFRLHQFLPQRCQYATILREPVARTVSHFLQFKRSAPPKSDIARLSIDEFFARPLPVDFDNLMTRLISGATADVLESGGVNETIYQHAIENLHKWFAYAGIQERANESFQELTKLLYLPASELQAENRSDPWELGALAVPTRAAIEQTNEYDLRLYRYVVENFWENGRSGWIEQSA